MSSEVRITLQENDIKKAIESVVTGPNKELVAEALFENLMESSSIEVEAFIKAVLGVIPELKYSLGQEVVVNKSSIGAWGFNEEVMEQKGMLKDGKIKAIIVRTSRYGRSPYKIKYDYWSTDDDKLASRDYDVLETQIELSEEFPENMS